MSALEVIIDKKKFKLATPRIIFRILVSRAFQRCKKIFKWLAVKNDDFPFPEIMGYFSTFLRASTASSKHDVVFVASIF